MSTLTRVESSPIASKTLGVAVALTLAGSIAGVVGAMVVGWLPHAIGADGSDAASLVTSRGVQFGFLAFALGYLSYTDEWNRYARFRVPGLTDLVAVVVAFGALLVAGFTADALVSALGLPSETAVGSSSRDVDLAAQPLLWLLVLVAWFAVAAPAEELFYRGIVQTRLRESFSTMLVLIIAASCFGLSHALFSALSGAGGGTVLTTAIVSFAAGLVFCGLYEWTDNLVPVALFHALTWVGAANFVAAMLETAV